MTPQDMNFSGIIAECGLECSETEFREYFDSIDGAEIEARVRSKMKVSKHGFDEKYNGNEIENEAGGEFYYVISVEGMVFLQSFVQGAEGFQPINSENVDDVMEAHSEALVSQAVACEKLNASVFHFSSK